VRYWDKGGSAGEGDYTAGVLMHKMKDSTYIVSHVARGQWGALERETKIKTWAEADKKMFKNYKVVVEMEPGGTGGGDTANLKPFKKSASRISGRGTTSRRPGCHWR
jgi:phage terminase large subunit-like protein